MSNNPEDAARKAVADAQEIVGKSVKAWSDLLSVSTDMAYDVVLKNWNYSRSVRGSAEQALEDALKTQSHFTKEMMGVWKDYADNVADILGKPAKKE